MVAGTWNWKTVLWRIIKFMVYYLSCCFYPVAWMIILREFDIKSKNSKLSVIDKVHINGGLLLKKQYAAVADNIFAMKLLNERCLECSICATFFSSSLTVSIKALFLSRILSAILTREFFILFLTLVTSCMPLRKRFSNSACRYISCRHTVYL